MAKIIKLANDSVSIGMANGSIKEMSTEDLDFIPEVGMEVEVYTSEGNTIVTKKKPVDASPGISVQVNNVQDHRRSVNKVVYCLLALFLGGIGAHKFYAGKSGTGVLYLLFAWSFILAFIAVIDFFIGLAKTSDTHGNIYF